MDDLPCDLSKLMNLNFENWIKVIHFLHRATGDINRKLEDWTNKFSDISNLTEEIDNFKIKNEKANQKMDAIEASISNVSNNMLTFDGKFQEIYARVDEAEKTVADVSSSSLQTASKVTAHEMNWNNWNRVVEEQVKDMEKYKDIIESNKNDISDMQKWNEGLSTEIKKVASDWSVVEKRVDLNMEEAKEGLKKVNKKVYDLDNRFTSFLAANQSTLNIGQGNQGELDGQNDNNYNQQEQVHNTGIVGENNQQGDQDMRTENRENNDKEDEGGNTRDKGDETQQQKPQGKEGTVFQVQKPQVTTLRMDPWDIERVNKQIKSLESVIDLVRYQHSQESISWNQKLKAIQEQLKSGRSGDPFATIEETPEIENWDELNKDIVKNLAPQKGEGNAEQTKKIIDSLKCINNSVGGKANLLTTEEQINSLSKSVLDIQNDLLIKYNALESQMKTLQKLSLDNSIANMNWSKNDGSNNNNKINLDGLLANLEEQIMVKLNKQTKDLIKENADSTASTFENIIKNIEEHSQELDKAFESIVDIRKNLLSKQLEQTVQVLTQKVMDNETLCRTLNFNFQEIQKMLEGEPEEAQKDDNMPGQKAITDLVKGNGSLRENLNLLGGKVVFCIDKVDQLEEKVEQSNRDIWLRLKRDLTNESSKVLMEYKSDLKISLSKIEKQLQEKVDTIGLKQFGEIIDMKLRDEMKTKLGHVELSKNTSKINRKIDTLENKISKTLVDTLIDLQMDEAPLMIKKNMKFEDKCASCNQALPLNNKNNGYYVNLSTDNGLGSYARYKTGKYSGKDKDKLPNILSP